jgi:hypothetical protein
VLNSDISIARKPANNWSELLTSGWRVPRPSSAWAGVREKKLPRHCVFCKGGAEEAFNFYCAVSVACLLTIGAVATGAGAVGAGATGAVAIGTLPIGPTTINAGSLNFTTNASTLLVPGRYRSPVV